MRALGRPLAQPRQDEYEVVDPPRGKRDGEVERVAVWRYREARRQFTSEYARYRLGRVGDRSVAA